MFKDVEHRFTSATLLALTSMWFPTRGWEATATATAVSQAEASDREATATVNSVAEAGAAVALARVWAVASFLAMA